MPKSTGPNAEDIERELESFLGPRIRATCKEWFTDRPELAAAVKRRAVDGAPTAALHAYLTERQGFEFGITAFKDMVRNWHVEATKERMAS
jgi:hypothetical protein